MPSITGDYQIDSLIAGAGIKWQPEAGQSVPTVTYSFMIALPSYATQTDANGFSVFTQSQLVAAREILANIQSEFSINFVEVTESADAPSRYGQIRFGNNRQANTVGYAAYPDPEMGEAAGDVYINNDPEREQTSNVVLGTNAYSTLIHEIGHALGLKHPGRYNAAEDNDGGAAQDDRVLPAAEDSENFSIMSYTTNTLGLERLDWGPYDRSALNYLYPAKQQNTSDNTYRFTDAAGLVSQTLVDDGGTDTIDASAVTAGIVLDLRPAADGTLSSVGKTSSGAPAGSNFSVALTSLIERAIGTSLADKITGNTANNTLTGGGGNDILDGGNGTDVALFGSALAGYTVSRTGGTYSVTAKSGTDGIDTITNVESLQFSDKTLNLAVQSVAASVANESVNRVAELYVAFFNRTPDADGLAYWIGELKSGKTISQISESFYSVGASAQYSGLTGFSTSMSDADFINLFYRNVLGRSGGADQGGLDYWSGKLARGESTRSSLANDILISAHTFKGDATYGYVADLLDNKIGVARKVAIDWGINFNSDAYTEGQRIAQAVTATDTGAALTLVGISASDLSIG